MLFAKGRYKANLDGDLTFEQQIEQVKTDSISGIATQNRRFEDALQYDLTRTVCNVFSNATIKYNGISNPFCISLQKNLPEIFYKLYTYGQVYVVLSESKTIIKVTTTNENGAILLIDKAFEISKITQKKAVDKALDLYGVVTNAMFSVIDERGIMGIFSPAKDTIIKQNQIEKIYDSVRQLFGTKKGQRKFAFVDVPLTYSGVALPIKDMELLLNKRDATATAARILGISEDMILSGSTFDNKENAIIQTYTDYKGLIYGYINQIESKIVSLSTNIELYEVTFPGVPQMNKPKETQTV